MCETKHRDHRILIQSELHWPYHHSAICDQYNENKVMPRMSLMWKQDIEVIKTFVYSASFVRQLFFEVLRSDKQKEQYDKKTSIK